MNTIFPLLYSSILFLSLTIICVYLVGQLKMTQSVEKRISLLETRLQTEERSSDNFYKLGQIYLRKKIYDKAINLFRQALKYWDENDKIGLGSLYNTLGFTYFRLKENEQAIYYYTQAIKLLPDYTLALTNLGLVYENKQMYEEAYKTYLNALKYDNENKIANTRLPIMKLKAEFKK
jgi:tetratricopeptide (TPR) repeat protein